MVPRRAEEGSKTIPDRKSNEEPHQDDHMTGLGPQGKGGTPSLVSPYGGHLGAQKRSKTEPKTIQNRSENRESKKTSQDDRGPVLERSWSPWGSRVGAPNPQKYWKT